MAVQKISEESQPRLGREHHRRLLGEGDPSQRLKDGQELSRDREG